MRINILTNGSRGDVQPYVALGQGLKAAGHHVTVVAPYHFGEWVTSYRLSFKPMRVDFTEYLTQPEIREALTKGNLPRLLRIGRELFKPAFDSMAEDMWNHSQDADLLIGSGTSFGILDIAEHKQVPLALGYVQPLIPRHEFNSAMLRLPNTPLMNRIAYRAFMQIYWGTGRPIVNRIRKNELGLRPASFFVPQNIRARQKEILHLYGYSSTVVEPAPTMQPFDHVTGYWFLDAVQDFEPPTDLMDFILSGPPPVYIGFGSMSPIHLERARDLAIEAINQSGLRAILAFDAEGVETEAISDRIRLIKSIPHAWLFPQMAAIVHHGGAGTTAASLRAGAPTIIIPFLFDQFAWGRIVEKLGVGRMLPMLNDLTPEHLAEALKVDSAMQERAYALGARIRTEDGIGIAVHHIQNLSEAQ